jgi:signal transduction histidine kinase
MKILHLEDNASDSILIERTLQRNGVEADVLCARSGEEFRTALDSGAFDVVLVDNGVPGFSGKAALQYSKINKAEIPVIICSGAARDEDVATRLKEGASDYVLKDHLWQLVAALRRVEDKRPAAAITAPARIESGGVEHLVKDNQALSRELETVKQELDAYSYAVSHDLRAPLRGISSQLEMLADSLPKEDNGKSLARIDAARTHLRQMTSLIDDLLRLSRIARLELRSEPFDLSALASDAIDRLRAQEPQRAVAVDIEPGIQVTGDRALLAVVLENLFANAWKFSSPQDHVRIEFGTALAADGQRWYFVRDRGVGFDPRYADKLFQPFQRLHRQDEFPGTGVGLATVDRIVRRHGGEVRAESAPGQGATFFFTLNPG